MEFTDSEIQAIRQVAPADLLTFSQWLFLNRKGYAWRMGDHHRVMADALMRVFDGDCKRLIINIPPRYSKTELAVVNFMAWALGNVPDAEFIHTSYSADLAANNAWQARELVQHDEFRAIFPGILLRSDSTARNHWRTDSDGCVYAVGSGGTITGFGAGKHRPGFGGAIIIDDPHKADEARSDIKRKNVIEWFQNTLESRKNGPETPIILIMQRLHEDDLAGWLLRGGNGETWEHVCLPAIRDDGKPLWPAKHDLPELRRMEQASPYVFAGQYMQRPAPLEGGLFKPDQLQVIDAVPAGEIRWCRGWDLASVTEDGDWTAGGKLGRLADGRYIIADMTRLQRGPDERDAAIVNTTALDGKSVVVSYPQDPGQAGKTQALYMTRALAGYRVKTSPETGDKVTRAEPLAAQVNVGNVMMLRGPWNEALVNEMRMFPNGSHDDQIDALSRAFAEVMAPRRSWFG